MPSTRSLLAVAVGAALLHTSAAWAGRPLQTEDAGVLGVGECELEAAGEREKPKDEGSIRAGSVQLGCGVGYRSQVALNAGRVKFPGGRADEVNLAGKTALLELADDATGVAVAWSFGGQKPRGGSFKYEATEIKGVVTHPVGDWQFHANLGWSRCQSDRRNVTIWSVAAERTSLGPVDVMAEVFGDDRAPAWLNAGIRWPVVRDRFFLDASYGVQMDSGKTKLATVGMKLAF